MDPWIRGITIFILIMWAREIYGIIGYDCGSASAYLTTLSLINVEECDVFLHSVNSSKIYVQLLQLNNVKSVKVIQCKVEIDCLIRKCGMFSYIDVYNGKYSYINEVTHEACQRMHSYLRIVKNLYNWIEIKSNHHPSSNFSRSCRHRWNMLRRCLFRSLRNFGETLLCWAASELRYKITLPMFG